MTEQQKRNQALNAKLAKGVADDKRAAHILLTAAHMLGKDPKWTFDSLEKTRALIGQGKTDEEIYLAFGLHVEVSA